MTKQRIIGIIQRPHGQTVVSRSGVDAVQVGDTFDVAQDDPTGDSSLWAVRTRGSGSLVAYARWADGAVPAEGILEVTSVLPGQPGDGRVVIDFAGIVTPMTLGGSGAGAAVGAGPL